MDIQRMLHTLFGEARTQGPQSAASSLGASNFMGDGMGKTDFNSAIETGRNKVAANPFPLLARSSLRPAMARARAQPIAAAAQEPRLVRQAIPAARPVPGGPVRPKFRAYTKQTALAEQRNPGDFIGAAHKTARRA